MSVEPENVAPLGKLGSVSNGSDRDGAAGAGASAGGEENGASSNGARHAALSEDDAVKITVPALNGGSRSQQTSAQPRGNRTASDAKAGSAPQAARADEEAWPGTSTSDWADKEAQRPKPTQGAARKQPDLAVFLATSRRSNLTGVLGWLAKAYDLDIHSMSGLTPSAAKEMRWVAFLLTLLFGFDLFAWSLLFNSVLNHGDFAWHNTGSNYLAILCGAFFAGATLAYERQFLTTDLWTGDGLRKSLGRVLSKAPAFGLRFGVLLGAALLTAYPMEVFWFSGPIERRIREEGTLDKAIELLNDRKELKQTAEASQEELTKQRDRLAVLRASREQQRYQDATAAMTQSETELQNATASSNTIQSRISRLSEAIQRNAQSLERQRVRASQAQNEEERTAARGEATAIQATGQTLNRQLDTQRGLLVDATHEIGKRREDKDRASQAQLAADKELQQKVDAIGKELEAKSNAAADQLKRDTKFLHAIRRSGATTVYEFGKNEGENKKGDIIGRTYADPPYDFFAKLRVLQDLRTGEAPRRPIGINQGDLATLKAEYGIDIEGENGASKDQRAREAQAFDDICRRVFLIVLCIPLLIFAVKLLVRKELHAYYSFDVQSARGNPELLALSKAIDKARQRNERKDLEEPL
jgi:hypothetical protein